MVFPTTREAWREQFKDGLTIEDCHEAFKAGIMSDQRYHFLFAQSQKKQNFRTFWEPRFKQS
ncbi:hypothetical protein BSY48_004429 [Salmonella enterica subsp. enterica serovar Agbeni]|nr:hypothetical protein [Salmonella enterica subsp. enterica serovar Agbeni]